MKFAIFDRLFGPDVFISYSTHDRVWADLVQRLFQQGRLSVFRDDTGLHPGDRIEELLAVVRRSTMLVVLVSERSLTSDWVRRELEAYCKRPQNRWRIVPIFLDDSCPESLPSHFAVLSGFKGIVMPLVTAAHPKEIERAPFLQIQLTSQFVETRKAVRQRRVAAVAAAFTLVAFGILIARRQIGSRRADFVRRAEVARADARFSEAEFWFAKAWQFGHEDAIQRRYSEARAHRVLEKGAQLHLERGDSIVAVDSAGGEPFAIVHSAKEGHGLFLIHGRSRSILQNPCGLSPLVAVAGSAIVWTCGSSLSAADLATSPKTKTVDLPTKPIAIRLRGNRVDILFRERSVAQLGAFMFPALNPIALDVLERAPENGLMGLCPESAEAVVWAASPYAGKIAARVWKTPTESIAELAAAPAGSGRSDTRPVSWISRVRIAPDCGRLFVEYALFTLGTRSDFEMARIRLNSPRPVDRFDSDIDEIHPAPSESGLEAVYLTSAKELRAFLLTSLVVVKTEAATLDSGVRKVGCWISDGRVIWTAALREGTVSVFRNRELWARYSLAIGEPVRVVASHDGSLITLEGNEASMLWRRASEWKGDTPETPEQIASEVPTGQ